MYSFLQMHWIIVVWCIGSLLYEDADFLPFVWNYVWEPQSMKQRMKNPKQTDSCTTKLVNAISILLLDGWGEAKLVFIWFIISLISLVMAIYWLFLHFLFFSSSPSKRKGKIPRNFIGNESDQCNLHVTSLWMDEVRQIFFHLIY